MEEGDGRNKTIQIKSNQIKSKQIQNMDGTLGLVGSNGGKTKQNKTKHRRYMEASRIVGGNNTKQIKT